MLEPAYLFWLTLNMCHLSNASLSLTDTFICIHFCHWIRNMQKRVTFSFIFRHYFPVWHLNVLVSGWKADHQKEPATRKTCTNGLLKTDKKNVLLVSKHCCETNGITMLRVLPPSNQTCLATNQVAESCCWKRRASVHVARFTDPKQICFATSDVTPVSGVTPA